ncbi:MAG: DUF2062 domain-containing protein [Deltaproteobacteria bacterium]|nr:DUF2062 domain-containing protein [Deltaproteobacteria bacterium]
MNGKKSRLWHERAYRWLRYTKIRLLRINDTPEKIAKGAALGVFLGIYPTFGLGLILAWVGSAVMGWNKAASILGSLIMNPLTTPFFWTLSAFTGGFIFNKDSRLLYEEIKVGELFANGGVLGTLKTSALMYLVGNTIIAVLFSGITYFIVKDAVIKHRNKLHEKRLRKREGAFNLFK